ncbi:glycosyltransferase involved in cell wall biosynthesis [Archangium gephyra]|uniref:Glycosyltransferase n=1 Tax=Archangium gephyra TaxID=48 RepID=A0AAC8Q3P2_9BACT|nr:glycosyltransferase family 4 protein [Archangium gephyra]AKJ00498.1 Glycosyltransferase [Archangium gephyra]REG32808.1 glycosyltransferase involved in cell wall biosynthesis [Archangium gephyra]
MSGRYADALGVSWHLLTGEFPPQPGGVSDYTWQVAEGLARAGCAVHVWAPGEPRETLAPEGVTVHRLPEGYAVRGLKRLEHELERLPGPKRLVVQYVPHAFGYKAMNVPFALWLARRRRDEVWMFFHEVCFPWGWKLPWRHNVLGAVTRAMAALVLARADRVFVSTPWWNRLLHAPPRRVPLEWLPVPSNLPTQPPASEVESRRAALRPSPDTVLIGHLGTYGALITGLLEEVLPALLHQDARRRVVLAGRGSTHFARQLTGRHPELAGRVRALGGLPGDELAATLKACDVLVQPFPDGLSTRRGSAMAGLGLGRPLVSNAGPATEAPWRSSGALALAPEPTAASVLETAEALLSTPESWPALGQRAADFYMENFSLAHTLDVLRDRVRARGVEDS